MDNWIPVVGAVLGGMLAVMGGFLSNYLLNRITRRNEIRKLLQEKLEEGHATCCKMVQDCQTMCDQFHLVLVGRSNLHVSLPIQEALKLQMIFSFYFPEMKATTESFLAAHKRFEGSTDRFIRRCHLPIEGDSLSDRDVPELKRIIEDDVAESMKDLERKLADLLAATAARANRLVV